MHEHDTDEMEPDETDDTCASCFGTGIGYSGPESRCWYCAGTGTARAPRNDNDDDGE